MPTFTGTASGDTLIGGNEADVLNGLAGNDILDGRGGVDQLFGGEGDDELRMSDAALDGEIFDGGTGVDSLFVSINARGGLGTTSGVPLFRVGLNAIERLQLGEQTGPLSTFALDVQIRWSQLGAGLSATAELVGRYPGIESLTILLPDAGAYTMPAFTLTSWSFQDSLQLIATGAGNYTLTASANIAGTQVLAGASGDDVLTGNAGRNELRGGAGADALTGGLDLDRLTGGSGNDLFIDTAAGFDGDVLTDFTVGDRIVIRDADIASFTFSQDGRSLTYSGGALSFGSFPHALVAVAAAEGGLQLTSNFRVAFNNDSGDFNGDGRDDLLWRSDGGAVGNWLGRPNGDYFINDSRLVSGIPAEWQIIGSGDFDGDGRADILWRNLSSGTIGNWLGTADGGYIVNDIQSRYDLPLDWQVVGIGNFLNYDLHDELLIRNSAGTVAILASNDKGGFATLPFDPVRPSPTDWHVVGIGDFNGDSLEDILWRHNDGRIAPWPSVHFGGWDIIDQRIVAVDLSWNVMGTGDFNGDGRDDILWRNDNGSVGTWYGNAGSSFTVNSALTPVSNQWQVAAIGDFNGDGRDDIFWRNATTGEVGNWLSTGTGFVPNEAFIRHAPPEWHVEAPDYLLF